MTLDDEDLFGDHVPERAPKAAGKAAMRKKVVITVKAAPNPSERHGEMCVSLASSSTSSAELPEFGSAR